MKGRLYKTFLLPDPHAGREDFISTYVGPEGVGKVVAGFSVHSATEDKTVTLRWRFGYPDKEAANEILVAIRSAAHALGVLASNVQELLLTETDGDETDSLVVDVDKGS